MFASIGFNGLLIFLAGIFALVFLEGALLVRCIVNEKKRARRARAQENDCFVVKGQRMENADVANKKAEEEYKQIN